VERESKGSLEFKKEAVKLSQKVGIERAAQELQIPSDTVAERRKSRSALGMIFQTSVKEMKEAKKQEALRDYIRENIELKKLIAKERRANEILKAARS
jgi:hypothetical protein